MTPSSFRTGGAKEKLCFAIGEMTLGSILVASSTRGVAAILLGDDPDALARDLEEYFPKATLTNADYEAIVAKVVGFVEAPQVGLDRLSTCAAPRSSSECGRRCATFR